MTLCGDDPSTGDCTWSKDVFESTDDDGATFRRVRSSPCVDTDARDCLLAALYSAGSSGTDGDTSLIEVTDVPRSMFPATSKMLGRRRRGSP